MQESIPVDITAALQWRIKSQEEIVRQEKLTRDYYLHDSLAWLLPGEGHDDELEGLSNRRHQGTCEWILKNDLFQDWKDSESGDPILWVKGIPGAGETYIISLLIRTNRLNR
jgi:hypothetical protein